MLSTSLVVAGLSTGHKIGLASVGGAFILFALVSSFVLPQRNPGFPGRNVGWYVFAGTLFFAAMMAAVIIFGREKKEAQAATGPDPGKIVFTKSASPSCGGCHTLKAAGTHGNVGPNLDQLKPSFEVVKLQVERGGGAMPSFQDKLSAQQIDDVAKYVSDVAGK